MHELSIVNSLLELCEEHAKENQATKVLTVKLAIGVRSGVEPELLRSSFETFSEKTICDGSKLEIDIKEVRARCDSCFHEFPVIDYRYICPQCDSVELTTTQGQEMHLISLEME